MSKVPIAGDSTEAKSIVGEVIRRAGFLPVDMGPLVAGETFNKTSSAVPQD